MYALPSILFYPDFRLVLECFHVSCSLLLGHTLHSLSSPRLSCPVHSRSIQVCRIFTFPDLSFQSQLWALLGDHGLSFPDCLLSWLSCPNTLQILAYQVRQIMYFRDLSWSCIYVPRPCPPGQAWPVRSCPVFSFSQISFSGSLTKILLKLRQQSHVV